MKTYEQSDSEVSSSLQALAIIANRLGVDVSIDQLRRRFALDAGEPTTATLIAIARELGLEARALQLSFQELPRLSRALPALLRARDGGALILEDARTDPTKGTVALIRDPSASDNAVIAIDELHLAEVWKGEAILVKRRHGARDDHLPFGMGWLLAQVLREKALFRDIGIGALVSTIFAIAPPFVFMIVLDRVLVNHSYSTLNVLAAAIFLMLLFETILSYLRRVLTQIATTRIDGRLNLYIMERLLNLPMDYFETTPTGKVLDKLSQIWMVRHFLTGQLFGAFLDSVPLIGLIPAMLLLEWRLALIAFLLAAIIFVIVMVFMKPIGRLHHKVVVAEQAKGSHLVETIYGIRTVKSLALEGRRRREWDHRVATVTAARHAFGLMANYPQTLSLPFERLIYSGCLLAGAYMVLNAPGILNAGALVAFSMLSMRLAQPLVRLATLQNDLAEVRTAISEVGSVVNIHPSRIIRMDYVCQSRVMCFFKESNSVIPQVRPMHSMRFPFKYRQVPCWVSWGEVAQVRQQSRACCSA